MFRRYPRNAELRELAYSNHVIDRANAARMLEANSPIALFDRLQRDRTEEVRAALLSPSTPSTILNRLADDESFSIRSAASEILKNNTDILISNIASMQRKYKLIADLSTRIMVSAFSAGASALGIAEMLYDRPLHMLNLPRYVEYPLIIPFVIGTASIAIHEVFEAADSAKQLIDHIASPFRRIHEGLLSKRKKFEAALERELSKNFIAAKAYLFLSLLSIDLPRASRYADIARNHLSYSRRLDKDMDYMYDEWDLAMERTKAKPESKGIQDKQVFMISDLADKISSFITYYTLRKIKGVDPSQPNNPNKKDKKEKK
ncbi:hypothetical protein M1394_00755 [Candidatus Marsarchaeota archaeon]|nr:hypothetical protein [Candidatus Marsarchaeota archaeon]